MRERVAMSESGESGRVYPKLPSGERFFVFGDLHGRLDLLVRLHRLIDTRPGRDGDLTTEIYLGDYVDRGPQSAEVVDHLLARAAVRRTVFLRGNHDALFEDFLEARLDLEAWRRIGGFETLLSYGIDVRGLMRSPYDKWVAAARHAVPASHRTFLATLRPFFAAHGFFFCHAGIRPGVDLAAQSPQDLLWVRDLFLGDGRDHGAVVVHGHTPVAAPDFRPNRINLDTGAYATGRLSCLMIDADGPRLLDEAPPRRGASTHRE